MNLTIEVELFGQLGAGRARCQALELQGQVTVRDVAQHLGLESEAIGIITINGVQAQMNDRVPNQCRLCFFPYLTGG